MENENLETTVEASVNVSTEDMDKLIRHHVWAAMGVGLLPLPIVDMVGLTAVQLNLVRKIAKAYEIPFFKDKVKNILGSLVGSAIPAVAGAPLAASIAKTIPVVGMTVGAVTMPVFAGAATYAIGKVFVQHFASGGTFLTFDPDKVKDYFVKMFNKGKEMVSKEGDKMAADVDESNAEEEKKADEPDKNNKQSKETDNNKKPDSGSGKNPKNGKK
ncbi:DUF697 domain-containing protein [Desulfobacterales bacterium HSG17]|nr:DUF697 domain-containing protein [Desulfobacterales bacterium HSG17]